MSEVNIYTRVSKPRRVSVSTEGAETRVKQSFKEECDVNTIMSRFKRTGSLEHVAPSLGAYRDVSEAVGYQEALHIVMAAEQAFMNLPAKIRKRFDNDPREFLEFCEDSENLEELRELGLAEAAQGDPDPVRVEVVGGPGAEPPAGA